MTAPPQLTRIHRVLIGVVTTGAVTIAGIGFAGSYAAVRDLALEKGFGTFSYLFPIGIDAGICVLLALDLLLTWTRIPFPLLRQTAWLLTAATIAFNGAAAWPDPLGVGMHAVIPLLFVVAVEAARHAIGRIADITADQHMDGIRPSRWLLSPLPTFLLWRRMKLWEIRSYDHVIKLEQERLVYQARLRTRYGRTWRRRAPVESLIPLRLARYGIPLPTTAPTGLTAADIELPLSPAAPHTPEDVKQRTQPARHNEAHKSTHVPPGQTSPPHRAQQQHPGDMRNLADTNDARPAAYMTKPTTRCAPFPNDHYGNTTTAARDSLPDRPWEPTLHTLRQHPTPPAQDKTEPDSSHHTGNTPARGASAHNTAPTPARAHGPSDAAPPAQHAHQRESIPEDGNHPVTRPAPQDHAPHRRTHDHGSTPPGPTPTTDSHTRQQPKSGPLPDPDPGQENATAGAGAAGNQAGSTVHARANEEAPLHSPAKETDDPPLTVVDHYYLAWMEYQDQYGTEPAAHELSAFLNKKEMHSRSGKPVSPSTLRRYPLPFRIYNIWAEHRARTTTPSADAVAHDCTTRNITAQYNKPITPHRITELSPDFQRRWHTLHIAKKNAPIRGGRATAMTSHAGRRSSQ
ncbi:DUF2637 domain-containing protein [Streptomyces hirsutus]